MKNRKYEKRFNTHYNKSNIIKITLTISLTNVEKKRKKIQR